MSHQKAECDEVAAVGLDIGGTKVAGGLVRFPDGEILERRMLPTDAHRPGDQILDDCLGLASALLDEANGPGLDVAGLGVAVPELLDAEGNIQSEFSLPWQGTPVVDAFSALAPTTIEMDNTSAALGEALFGEGRRFRIFLYVTVGTGLGCTLVQDRVPFKGARGSAGVFGNGPYSVVCEHCGWTTRHVLDEFASGPALARRYSDLTQTRIETAEEVFAACRDGASAACEILTAGGSALGVGVGLLVDILDPEAVIVGGGLGLAGGPYWEAFQRSTREHIWSSVHRDLPIHQAGLGGDAGIIGAAASAWQAARFASG